MLPYVKGKAFKGVGMMKHLSGILAAGLLSSALIGGAGVAGLAQAQTLNSDAIVNSLKPKAATRSLTRSFNNQSSGPSAEDSQFLNSLPTRGIRIEQRKKLEEIVKKEDLPRIDIEIGFDYDSAAIRSDSVKDVIELGKALASDALAGSRIVLNGHTDAAGSDAYNQELSERRAVSVRKFLVDNFGIKPDRLVAIGYGEESLKNTGDPLASENRRVEVINLTSG